MEEIRESVFVGEEKDGKAFGEQLFMDWRWHSNKGSMQVKYKQIQQHD